jgi:hypothetical protein
LGVQELCAGVVDGEKTDAEHTRRRPPARQIWLDSGKIRAPKTSANVITNVAALSGTSTFTQSHFNHINIYQVIHDEEGFRKHQASKNPQEIHVKRALDVVHEESHDP